MTETPTNSRDLNAYIEPRYRGVLDQINAFSSEAERASPPGLLAVSKGQSLAKIKALYNLGHRQFGENYFQELKTKSAELDLPDLEWHYIGQLQSNKINKIVSICHSIHSLASVKHAHKIGEAAKSLGKSPFPVFMAVNISGEAGKSGCHPSDAAELGQKIAAIDGVRLLGLMAVPSRTNHDPSPSQPVTTLPQEYLQLKELAQSIGDGLLSLGMSGDLRLAIHAGSTVVRIGTNIFGPRA